MMKKIVCVFVAAACLLSAFVLSAAAVSLTPMQQMQILCEYQTLASNMDGAYATYGYFDFDGDGIQELILRPGASEATARYYVYGWKNGAVREWGSFSAGHSGLYTPYGEHRLIRQFGQMGHEVILEVKLKNGVFSETVLSDRTLGYYDDYTDLGCPLEMYPRNYSVFPDSDHLTTMQDRYIDELIAVQSYKWYTGDVGFYLFPDMTGGGYPDIIAAYPLRYDPDTGDYFYADAYEYVLYENKNGSFVNDGGFIGEFVGFSYPYSGKGVLAGDPGDGAWRLTISNGRFNAARINSALWHNYDTGKSVATMFIWGRYPYSRPNKPASVKAQALSSTSIRLTWTESYRTNRSDIYLLDPQTKEYVYYDTVIGSFSYTATGLTPGKTYTFKVKSVEEYDGNYDGYEPYSDYTVASAFSPAASATTPAAPVKITAQPKSVTVKEGETASFSVKAEGSGLTYCWQYSKDGTAWGNCGEGYTGYDTAAMQVQALMHRNGIQYRCKVTGNGGSTAYSAAATLSVQADPPEIVKQPEDTFVIENAQAFFTVEAKGTNLKYRWQYLNAGSEWKNCGVTTPTLELTATAGHNGAQYRCVVYNAVQEVISDPAVLTVDVVKIKKQPQSVTLNEGETAKFSVEAEGWYLSYRWQFRNENGAWTNCGAGYTGADTNEMTVPATAKRDGMTYRCVVKNSAGAERISKEVTLTVKTKAPAFMLGDVDANGAVDSADARLALRRAVGLEDYKEGSAPFLACDVTKDGAVTAEDARLILRAAVGLETLA